MPKFPEPPPLLAVAPEPHVLLAGTRLWRIWMSSGAHPTTWGGFRFFGPTAARFDHHDAPAMVQRRGILYAALAPTTCLAEVFQATRVVDRLARDPWLAAFELTSDVVLLDLFGAWPTRAGASMAIASGPRPRARRWSRTIYASYPDMAGLYYPSSMHANAACVALYERASAAIPSAPAFDRALADPALATRLATAASRIGYRLV